MAAALEPIELFPEVIDCQEFFEKDRSVKMPHLVIKIEPTDYYQGYGKEIEQRQKSVHFPSLSRSSSCEDDGVVPNPSSFAIQRVPSLGDLSEDSASLRWMCKVPCRRPGVRNFAEASQHEDYLAKVVS
ncbi:hypothetical protein CAPTEDRAFT_212575 [Capitella teleta]|uniref:Uncharacterized protein n=1 Tax=Capitella teleta TaxID=283909 RepID=R7V1M7_CAPTE|nr:hypothetical protein CAPTEDRAFT_212575 [Capitella teleta]|eukprot:ELU09561.1 hypothetical protein CAPTEDRAFT_212575 [Capitella teleta]